MKFLIIEQDLRVSGTSQGIISRSFLAKLRTSYPNAVIDVLYLKNLQSDDQLHLLPVDSVEEHVLNLKIPLLTKWLNKINWRLFHTSLQNKHIHKVYASYIAKLDYSKYDHIFIRSSGLDHETILACRDLPILKKAIVNFHDPYPLFWYPGTKQSLTSLEMFKVKDMFKVVSQAKTCTSTAMSMSNDLAYLYGNRKKFYTLPHQYSSQVFDFSDTKNVLKKNKKVLISYHGAIMFGRNIDVLLDAYGRLINANIQFKENTEFVVRLRGQDNKRLTEKYKENKNIKVLDTLNFSNSCYEQVHEASINIILENGPFYSNTLVGKAPFLASITKPVLVLAPERSELRQHVRDQQFIASYDHPKEVEQKLENLIRKSLISNEAVHPFGDYFSDEKFKIMLDEILS
jgi:hypothetical protein